MCDCYEHKCECCNETIPMHIEDFNYPRNKFKVWCYKHAAKAIPGSVIFTIIGLSDFDELDGVELGWQCAIYGPGVGKESGNAPNLCSEMTEWTVEDNNETSINTA